jgi:hypothetical protein
MNKKTKDQVLTMALRETLKSIIHLEIQKLPDHLEGLDPKERLAVLCKLMPFVFPKVEAVHQHDGEPYSFD